LKFRAFPENPVKTSFSPGDM